MLGKSSSPPRSTAAPAPARAAPEPPRRVRAEGFERPNEIKESGARCQELEGRPPQGSERPSAAEPSLAPAAPVEPHAPPTPAALAIEDARLAAIQTRVYHQSNFLGSCLEHLSGFQFKDGEAYFEFAQKDSFYADLVKAREQLEILRSACAEVLGQPVKICVRLKEQGVVTRTEYPSARERAERDPGVEAFRKKFDGAVLDVKDLSRE